MLVRADKMEINWARSHSVCRRTVTDGLRGPVCVSLLGRWLLAGDEVGLRCYDLDATENWDDPVAQIPVRVKCLGAQVATNNRGLHLAFAVIHQMRHSM
jgi:hypothetical protein